jgi:hypothetical protein
VFGRLVGEKAKTVPMDTIKLNGFLGETKEVLEDERRKNEKERGSPTTHLSLV